MKREILFRGKRKDNGDWELGQLVFDATGNPRIVHLDKSEKGLVFIEVHPDTVCQFTGLLDKNGNKIFEGDKGYLILKGVGKGECIIEFESGCFVINANGQTKKMPLVLFDSNYHEIEITGNVHDK